PVLSPLSLHDALPISRRANDAIKERDVQAEGRTTRERLHQPARSRTVEKQFVAHTHVIGRHDNRQAVVDERDLADKSFIEDRVRSEEHTSELQSLAYL